MPYFQQSDPRHPTNRAHVIYLAAAKAQKALGQEGQVISTQRWRRMVKVATGVLTDKAAHDYTVGMEDLLMIRVLDRKGVQLRPDGLRLVAG